MAVDPTYDAATVFYVYDVPKAKSGTLLGSNMTGTYVSAMGQVWAHLAAVASGANKVLVLHVITP